MDEEVMVDCNGLNQSSTLFSHTTFIRNKSLPETEALGDFLFTNRNPTAHVHNTMVMNRIVPMFLVIVT